MAQSVGSLRCQSSDAIGGEADIMRGAMRWLAAARPSSKRENAMRVGIALALIALAYSVDSYSAPAIAQHHASKQKAEKPKTDAELIASAMGIAPTTVELGKEALPTLSR